MNRFVIVTGVSGGIGSATATTFRAEGWSVIGVDVAEPHPAALDAFARIDLGAAGAGVELRSLISGLSDLHALVNVAGIQGTDSIDDSTVSD
ncbi:MAG: SDR family NAD(P)-dependent oxidoreductase, partial [Vicinamibacterales bacterium]